VRTNSMTETSPLRTTSDFRDDEVQALLEGSFVRVGAEMRLVEELRRQDPDFDGGLALVAEKAGEPVGFALFTQRYFKIRGTSLPLAILAPLAVSPAHRRHGVARQLLEAGRKSLTERGRLGVVTIGAPELFSGLGYGSAFDMRYVRMPAEYLPEEGDTTAWRALAGEDLGPLCELHEQSYRGISGTEVRRACALDWEGLAEGSFTLVYGAPGEPGAYLRFRRRAELEVTECGARDPAGVDAILRLMRRLTREHATPMIAATLAPPHPVARAMYQRGAMIERCNFGGAAFLGVYAWQPLFEMLRSWWEPILRDHSCACLSLEIEGERVVLGDPDRTPSALLWIPGGWGPSLLTGMRSASDLLFEPTVRENSKLSADQASLVHALFTRCDAAWSYGPAFELADD